MDRLAGVFVALFGFILLMISGFTKDALKFQFSIVFSFPFIYLGLRLLMS